MVRLRSAFDRSRFVSATSDALKRAVRGELEQLFSRVALAGHRGVACMIVKRLLMGLVKGYRLLLSPWLGRLLPL